MKALHPEISMWELCRIFNKSRQAWYKSHGHSEQRAEFHAHILEMVKQERIDQPRLGGKKLHYLLNERLAAQGLCIGRDQLFSLLRTNGLLIRQRKKYRPKQTNGNGESIYPDLRKDLIVREINELWCGDITYIELQGDPQFSYCMLITDEKSHLIVGHEVSAHMRTNDVLEAFKMAIQQQAPPSQSFGWSLVFHSDRGSQFKSAHFRQYLQQHQIKPSMCEAGKSYENPVAERINGILKGELLGDRPYKDLQEAKRVIGRAIEIYNTRRPHLSCQMMTPQQAHNTGLGPLKKLWRTKTKGRNTTFPTANGP